MSQEYSVEEQLAQANRQLAELQRQVIVLMQGYTPAYPGTPMELGNEVTAIVPTQPFMSDTQYSVGLHNVDEDRISDIMLDGPPAPRLLKRPLDGCTPDVWDAYGRLMQYEPLPEQSGG